MKTYIAGLLLHGGYSVSGDKRFSLGGDLLCLQANPVRCEPWRIEIGAVQPSPVYLTTNRRQSMVFTQTTNPASAHSACSRFEGRNRKVAAKGANLFAHNFVVNAGPPVLPVGSFRVNLAGSLNGYFTITEGNDHSQDGWFLLMTGADGGKFGIAQVVTEHTRTRGLRVFEGPHIGQLLPEQVVCFAVLAPGAKGAPPNRVTMRSSVARGESAFVTFSLQRGQIVTDQFTEEQWETEARRMLDREAAATNRQRGVQVLK